ncbi:MAG: GNAT family N-acetyltransferase [Polyangiaceae bacterium]
MTLVARDARAEDYPAFARLFLELKVPDPTPSAEQFDARIRPSTFFLFEGERPIAYSFWQALGEVARVIHVVVDPTAQGRGVGRALLREVGTRGMRAGCSRWTLHVKPDNVPARRLYERCGMRVVARSRSMEIAWSEVERLPLGESEGETEAFHVRPEEEAQVEGAAGLLAGQIGALRKGGGWVFLGLRRGDEIVAFAAFDPSFPGAMPFVAPRPWLTRRLLEAMRPHALAKHAGVRFPAMNDEVWGAAEGAGARVILETLRMEGPITV